MKIITYFLVLATLGFNQFAFSAEDCHLDNGKPNIPKFDFNFMGCYNFYAVDLGMDAANKKCKLLSPQQDFSDKNFSKCIEIYQPSRSEWKADITDKCIELSQKNDFLSLSFDACLSAFSISTSGSASKEKKILIESASTKCLELSKKVDFATKSFVRCFYFYGGNHYPPSAKDAQESLEIAELCSTKVQDFNFASEKMSQCWDVHRINSTDRKKMVNDCLNESH